MPFVRFAFSLRHRNVFRSFCQRICSRHSNATGDAREGRVRECDLSGVIAGMECRSREAASERFIQNYNMIGMRIDVCCCGCGCRNYSHHFLPKQTKIIEFKNNLLIDFRWFCSFAGSIYCFVCQQLIFNHRFIHKLLLHFFLRWWRCKARWKASKCLICIECATAAPMFCYRIPVNFNLLYSRMKYRWCDPLLAATVCSVGMALKVNRCWHKVSICN